MMKKWVLLVGVAVLVGVCLPAGATSYEYVWDMTYQSDYYLDGSASLVGGQGIVAAQSVDKASIFAKINTQALLKVGQITGGEYTVTNLSPVGNAGVIYGSLYLSPLGGSGSNVLILLSPMTQTTESGAILYTFDLATHADYRTMDSATGTWTAYDSNRSGTFAHVVDLIDSSSYSGDYASFWGPQIGESSSSYTAFGITQIALNPVPEPITMFGAFLGISSLGMYIRRRTKVKAV